SVSFGSFGRRVAQQARPVAGPRVRRDDQDSVHSASPLSSRGTSPDNPAAWRMNRLFNGGARSTRPRPMSRTVRKSVDSFENNRFSDLEASTISIVSRSEGHTSELQS